MSFRGVKFQFSKVMLYWAVLAIVFAIIWTMFLNTLQLSGMGAAVTLSVPVVIAGFAALSIYRLHDYQMIEYDDMGYRISRGRSEVERHDWSEFKGCSIVRDSYGKVRVRAYVERDGDHVEIDPASSGIDPYSFRNVVDSHIRGATGTADSDATRSSTDGVFDGLEREIQSGRANWVADLNESFRGYQISSESFPLVARGNTRPKGFLLSRFVAFTMMPDYRVCLYASQVKGVGSEAKSHLMKLIRIIETQRDEKDIKWSWLLLLSKHEVPEALVKTIESFGNKDVGVGCIELDTGRIITSPNQLGTSLRNQMRFDRLIKDLKKKRMVAS
jgi:hypothetical protein